MICANFPESLSGANTLVAGVAMIATAAALFWEKGFMTSPLSSMTEGKLLIIRQFNLIFHNQEGIGTLK